MGWDGMFWFFSLVCNVGLVGWMVDLWTKEDGFGYSARLEKSLIRLLIGGGSHQR
jgi:hypothetical protein